MDNDKIISIVVAEILAKVRMHKDKGIPNEDINDVFNDDCYVIRQLKKAGIKEFRSECEGGRVIDYIRLQITQEIINYVPINLQKCDYFYSTSKNENLESNK